MNLPQLSVTADEFRVKAADAGWQSGVVENYLRLCGTPFRPIKVGCERLLVLAPNQRISRRVRNDG
jgi:hypothetical protein